MQRRTLMRAAAALAALSWKAARALERPSGAVVLTVSGRIRNPNDGAAAQFDMAMLEQLPQTQFTTRTPWYSQPRKFGGPLLREVLSAAGAEGTRLRATALNDYRVDIPWDDAQRHDVIVAVRLDDKPMAVRDKGPLFVLYPFDAEPELRTQIYFNRSIWQLRKIEVL